MKKYISIILFFTLSLNILAQQNNTMFYMHRLPQSTLLNPAIQPGCKLTISGLAIPLFGQLFPAIHTNAGSNGFAYKDFVQYSSALDSLMIPTNEGYDYEHLLSKLKKINYLTFEEHLDLLSVGYQLNNNWRITFNIAEKTETRFNFSKDIMQFIADGGNGNSFSGETALFNLGLTMTQWHEIGIGASKKLDSKWTVGARAKLLFGIVSIWSEKSDFTWYTDANSYDYTLQGNMKIHTSQPFYKINEFYYNYADDTLIYDGENLNPSANDVIMNFSNPGASIDLGAEYIYNDKITLYASIIDLGFIHWTTNTNTFEVSGDYFYDGYDPQPHLTENDSVVDEYTTQKKQELIHIFMPKKQNETYNSYLAPKFHLGGTYKINDKLNVGALYRGTVFQDHLHSSFTLSGNANLNKWFTATLSYSMMYNQYTNIGVGLIARAKFMQFYVVTDNFWAGIWPQSARNFNLRLGINLVFGCVKKNSKTLVGSSDL